MTVPLAHAGHWVNSLIYLVPVVVIALALGWNAWRDRRTGRNGDEEEPDEPTLDEIMDGKGEL